MNIQFHLELDPEIVDRCEEIRSIASKKWTNASSVSLAKLDQVKTKIYNLGLNDAKDLQPSSCISLNHRSNSVELDELKTEPPLSTLSYQRTAWGSNTSIPELLKQQSARGRPVSSNLPSRTRPWSGKKTRPNTSSVSSKPPIVPGRVETSISVKGAKYDPAVNKRILTPHSVTGWAAPPSGHNDQDHFLDVPRVPASSPDFSDDEIDGKLGFNRSPTVLLRKPTPEPLHLQLPSVGEYEDDDDQGLDTDRLLEKASVLTHKNNTSSFPYNFLNGSSECLPSIANNNDIHVDSEDIKANQRSEVIGKVISANVNSTDGDVLLSPRGDLNNSNIETNSLKSSSVLFREDKNTVLDITTRKQVTNSRPTSASFKRQDYKNVQSRINSGIDKTAFSSRNSSLKQSSSDSSEYIDPMPISVSKLSPNPYNNGKSICSPKTSSNNLKVDYDSSTNQMPRPTSPITIINLGYGEDNATRESVRGFRPASPKRQNSVQRPTTPVTIVTVDYGEESSRKNDTDELVEADVTPSILLINSDGKRSRPTSAKTKNYYEEAIKTNGSDKVYKTTKTIEFATSGPKGTSIRSALNGEMLKPTEALTVSDEQLKKSKQSRPPSVKKAVKPKPPQPAEVEEPTTEELFQTDIPISFKKPLNLKTRKETTNIEIPPLHSFRDKRKVSFSRAKSAPVRLRKSDTVSKNANFMLPKEKRSVIFPDDVMHINSKNAEFENIDSAERRAMKDMTAKLAANGINIAAETLERALCPPMGRTLYYDIPGYLPSYTSSLLSHPKVWMPEQYKRFKEAEKQLERAENMLWIQRRKEEREQGNTPIPRKPQTAKKRKKKANKVLKRSQSFS